MATTAIIPIHAGKGRPIATALKLSTDYVKNPEKTESGQWVTAYECDPLIVDKEFMYSKKRYAAITGRSQGSRDVIAYHLRIAFKPGETDAETANRIGYELAMKLTRGNHAFVCCTHVDKAHTHSHIVINSTSLDCTKKFRNFKNSAFAVRRIADHLCVENGLSIIEKPKLSKGKTYGRQQGDKKPPSNRDRLKDLIDNALCVGNSFQEFIARMEGTGCGVKIGKNIAFKLPDAQRYIRLSSLGEGYTEDDIKKRLAGLMEDMRRANRARSRKQQAETKSYKFIPFMITATTKFSLIIDIQQKIQEGKDSPAYKQWATIHNLKQMAKTLIFLKEAGIDSYAELVQKTESATAEFNARMARIKEIENKQKAINELQKSIGTYRKTHEIFAQYRASGWSKRFYNAHADAIEKHKAARKHFDSLGYGKTMKFPSVKSLQQEWGELETERNNLYRGYRELKTKSQELLKARFNCEEFLGINREPQKPSILGAVQCLQKMQKADRNVPEYTSQKQRDHGAR